MNLGAIAHMPDNRYCYCLRPKHFLIRLQTGRDHLREVIIYYQDKYRPLRFFDTRKKSCMKLVAQDHSHDYFEVELAQGDILLLCTDGLTNNLSDEEIYSVVCENKSNEFIDILIDRANENGGSDNMTVVAVVD